MLLPNSVTGKKSPNLYKSCPKNDLTRKIKDFDPFTKIALECGRFGQIICCQRLLKVAKSNKLPNLVTLVVNPSLGFD